MRSNLGPVIAALVLVGGAIFLMHRPKAAPDDPLQACPAQSFLVAKVDAAALRATPLGTMGTSLLAGLLPLSPAVRSGCELDNKVDTIALTVPEGEDRSDLGVALKLRMTSEELGRCRTVVMNEGAERDGSNAATSGRGAFTFFGTGDARANTLAAAENGLALLGDREWVASMADAASGTTKSAVSAPPHSEILRGLGARSIVVSVALPKATRARIRQEMESEVSSGSNGAMAGVLGVEAIGLALDIRDQTELTADLFCDSSSSCAAVNELIERKRATWSQNPILRLLGVGSAVDALGIKLAGRKLEVSTRLPTSDLASAITQALAFRKSRAAPAALPLANPRPAAPGASGERDASSPSRTTDAPDSGHRSPAP